MWTRIPVIAALVLAISGGAARADKVDWSQYIDKDAKTSRAPASTAPPVVTDARAATKTKSTATKKVAAKPKAKAKARRRH